MHTDIAVLNLSVRVPYCLVFRLPLFGVSDDIVAYPEHSHEPHDYTIQIKFMDSARKPYGFLKLPSR